VSPAKKSASALRNLLSPRRSRSDSDEDHTRALNAGIDDPPIGAEGVGTTSRSSSSYMVAQCAPLRQPQSTEWGRGWPGTELMIVNGVEKWWKQRRSCRGTLHDDDDDAVTVARSMIGDWHDTVVCLSLMLSTN